MLKSNLLKQLYNPTAYIPKKIIFLRFISKIIINLFWLNRFQLFSNVFQQFFKTTCEININNQNVALILGDNFFYGQSLTKTLKKCVQLKNGAKIFLHPVKSPSLYGIATQNKKSKIIKIVEKPKNSKSNLAVTGLYFFDKNVVKLSKQLKPSKRGELEITDLINKYLKKNKLNAELIGRGGTWLDTGTMNDFYSTSNYVSAIENRQGLKIACLEEIAYNYNWIEKKEIINSINFYGNCEYSKYLKSII